MIRIAKMYDYPDDRRARDNKNGAQSAMHYYDRATPRKRYAMAYHDELFPGYAFREEGLPTDPTLEEWLATGRGER